MRSSFLAFWEKRWQLPFDCTAIGCLEASVTYEKQIFESETAKTEKQITYNLETTSKGP